MPFVTTLIAPFCYALNQEGGFRFLSTGAALVETGWSDYWRSWTVLGNKVGIDMALESGHIAVEGLVAYRTGLDPGRHGSRVEGETEREREVVCGE